MAAPVKNQRILATRVRELSLKLIEKYLKDESETNAQFRKELILKLAATALPRITEVSGADGAPISVNLIKYGGNDPA